MAKLILKFEKSVLKELPLTKGAVTIGRLPDNVIQVDNPAVSSHHAKIYWDNDHFVVEDNGSLNGTFVNDQRVTKHSLNDGDTILVGKHTLLFQAEPQAEVAPAATEVLKPTVRPLEGTMMLDTKKARELIAQAMAKPAATPSVPAPAPAAVAAPPAAAQPSVAAQAPAPARAPAKRLLGVLSVMAGKAGETHYVLTSKLTVIGKSEMASIRLKGWFAPKVAGAINRRDDKYFIAPSDNGRKVKVNGAFIEGQTELHEGDIIAVGKLQMSFKYRDDG